MQRNDVSNESSFGSQPMRSEFPLQVPIFIYPIVMRLNGLGPTPYSQPNTIQLDINENALQSKSQKASLKLLHQTRSGVKPITFYKALGVIFFFFDFNGRAQLGPG